MEKNKNDQKLGSACSQQSQTIEPQGKQHKAQPNGALGPSTKVSSASHDNMPNSKQQQQPPIAPKPYTPQSATEQFMAVSMPTHQWLQGQMFAQSAPPPPFWQPQWPAGVGPFLGANVSSIYQTFTTPGTTDPSWQGVVPGGNSSTTQPQVPNMCYPLGYTFAGFPGPCDQSSWYQLQHPYVYNVPGALGCSSATPTTPGCSASGEQSMQRGIIKPTAKLSQKHQHVWEAQSAENAQQWSVINKLQAEFSDYKDRLTKLEEEVSSLKQKQAAPPTEVNGNIPLGTGQPTKRGRPPKRSLSSAFALHQESLPRNRGRKPAPSKPQFELKSPIFEKVVLKGPDNKEIANHSAPTMAKQQTNEKILNAIKTDVSGDIQNSQSNSFLSAHQGEIYQEYQGPQTCASGSAYDSGARVYFKNLDLLSAYHVLPNPKEVTLNNRIISARYLGNTGNRNQGEASCIPSQNSARELLDAATQGLFRSSNVTKQEQGARLTPGHSSANEEDASEEQDDTNSGSAEDENEEEMGDDSGSTAEETGVPKDVGECPMNDDMVTSPKDLSPLNNW